MRRMCVTVDWPRGMNPGRLVDIVYLVHVRVRVHVRVHVPVHVPVHVHVLVLVLVRVRVRVLVDFQSVNITCLGRHGVDGVEFDDGLGLWL